MSPSAVLLRVRFPRDVADHLADIAKKIGRAIGRKVPRAALIRAVVKLHVDELPSNPRLAAILDGDTVRRGRAKGPKGGAS